MERCDVRTGGAPLRGHTDWVRTIVAVPVAGGVRLVTGGNDGSIIVWDAESGRQLLPAMTGHRGTVRSLGLVSTGSGEALVSIGGDQTVRLWDVESGSPLHVLPLGVQPHILVAQRDRVAIGTDAGVLMLGVTGTRS
ncbi:WD40 repeat domain-containing protein [Catellatospora bangladeshensis]|uniref:WD40 repeat domain-containing protein n=1 Tax=Catellatospora bangladeshensis TaxID=310355 RepID=UPI00360E34BC